MPKLLRITTVPLSLKVLLTGQMKYMKEHGFEVLMVSADGDEVKGIVENEQCLHKVVNIQKKINPIKDLISLYQFIKVIREFKPDIVHSHTPKAGIIGMLGAFLCRVPVRLHTNSGTPLLTATGFSRILIYCFEKLSYLCATFVYTNSNSLKSFLIENNLISPKKIEVLGKGSSNGIDLKRFSHEALDSTKLDKIKSQIEFDKSIFYFVFIGRIVKSKGITELIDAFEAVFSNHPNIRLLMVGNFEDDFEPIEINLKNRILTHEAIKFVGWSNEVEYYLAISDCLVFPTHREGFPNVLLQAGAMKCPILCTDAVGNVDIVSHESTGIMFPVGNTEILREKMNFVLENQEQVKNYANHLFQIVHNDYAREKVHEILFNEYKKKIN
jgi:glycosyltransferase involved in cell wall biosynthesis